MDDPAGASSQQREECRCGLLFTDEVPAKQVYSPVGDNLILASKKQYYANLVSSSSDNPRRLWQTSYLHFGQCSRRQSASFFTDKISKLLSLANSSTSASPYLPSSPITPPYFSTFKRASESEISKILFNCLNKQSDSDPIPTSLLKECAVHCWFLSSLT